MRDSPQATLPRVLFLDHVGVLGGAELCLIDLSRHMGDRSKVILFADGPLRTALEATGANVTVLAAPDAISQVRRTTGLRHSIRTVPHVLILAYRIAKWARKYDLIWANSQKSFVIGCFAAFLSRRPLVWHMHDILTADHFSPTNRKIAVALANRFAASVVTVSEAGRQSFIDCDGKPGLVRVVYNGIEASRFGTIPGLQAPAAIQTSAKPVALRDKFGIGSNPLVGIFGRITAWKSQDVLIRALPFLPGVHAIIVGDALFNEQEYSNSLPAIARELGVADRTHFAGFCTDVASAMAEMDLIAHTSTAPEPFGRVIVEAMLARKPIIASAAGGAAEIVTDQFDGLLVQPGDPAVLADAIRQLLGDPVMARELAEQGYQTAVTRFSLTNFLTNVDVVVSDVCNTKASMLTNNRQAPDAAHSDAIQSQRHKAELPAEAV